MVFSNSKIRALSIPYLWRAMTTLWFSLPVHSIVTAQTRLECFATSMSRVSNVKITFGCVQFVSHKSCFYTCINIYGRTRYIPAMEKKNSTRTAECVLLQNIYTHIFEGKPHEGNMLNINVHAFIIGNFFKS